jgi:hypothetical protein
MFVLSIVVHALHCQTQILLFFYGSFLGNTSPITFIMVTDTDSLHDNDNDFFSGNQLTTRGKSSTQRYFCVKHTDCLCLVLVSRGGGRGGIISCITGTYMTKFPISIGYGTRLPVSCGSNMHIKRSSYNLCHQHSRLLRIVFYHCCGFVTFWFGSGSGFPDPYLWLMDPDPDPTPDPTPFFSDFKDVKKSIFFILISYNLPTGTSSSVLKLNFLLRFCVKILFYQALFQSTQDINEKREGSGTGSGSAPLTNESGSGCPINMRIRIRIPNTSSNYKRYPCSRREPNRSRPR